jgi:hypothetical protein
MIGAIGGKRGGIPVRREEARGVKKPAITEFLAESMKEPTARGMYIGRKTDPSPRRWKTIGSAMESPEKITAIITFAVSMR